MRVLVVGTSLGSVDMAAEKLTRGGHEVVRCHDPDEAPFPCAGLIDGRQCPLDSGPVDVVVTTRDLPTLRPTSYESGAPCALRRHVPLVVADAVVNPFERWTVREIDEHDDLVAACEEAAGAPLLRHSDVATAAVREIIVGAGLDEAGAGALVHRSRGVLKVTIALPAGAVELEGSVTARVLTMLRELDPHAPGIDVAVTA